MSKFRLKLVENWQEWHKWWSMRLAAIVSAVMAFLWASPEVALQVLNQLPPETRAYLSPIVGLVLFGIVFLSRTAEQAKLRCPEKDETDEAGA